MKKVLIVAALLASFNAAAYEVGVVGGGATGNNDGGLAGVTFGHKFSNNVGITAGYAQAWLKDGDQNRYTLVASYDVYKNNYFVVAPKVGYAYLNQTGNDGSAGLVGLGIEVPLSKNIALTADYAYQFAQNSNLNGNILTGGLKYKF